MDRILFCFDFFLVVMLSYCKYRNNSEMCKISTLLLWMDVEQFDKYWEGQVEDKQLRDCADTPRKVFDSGQ